jgi:hypothetical protein
MKNLGLADIQGIDSISAWPPGPAWWVVLGIVALIVLAFAWDRRRRRIASMRWQAQVLEQLRGLEAAVTPANSQATAIELAPLVRRLAIQRASRTECAALEGDDWLGWLTARDPAQFDWRGGARFLVEAPFRPSGAIFDPESVRRTIQAARKWVQ